MSKKLIFTTNTGNSIEIEKKENSTKDTLYQAFGEEYISYNLNGENLGVIIFDRLENGIILRYIETINRDDCKLALNKIKGLGLFFIRDFIKTNIKNKIIIDSPFYEKRKFWFKVVKKLYNKGVIKDVKFIKYERLRELKKIENLEISCAFRKIILYKNEN